MLRRKLPSALPYSGRHGQCNLARIREYDDLGADRHAAVEVGHVRVRQRMQPLETLVPIVAGALVP
jgi:hypothetical protein